MDLGSVDVVILDIHHIDRLVESVCDLRLLIFTVAIWNKPWSVSIHFPLPLHAVASRHSALVVLDWLSRASIVVYLSITVLHDGWIIDTDNGSIAVSPVTFTYDVDDRAFWAHNVVLVLRALSNLFFMLAHNACFQGLVSFFGSLGGLSLDILIDCIV